VCRVDVSQQHQAVHLHRGAEIVRFIETRLRGSFIIDLQAIGDNRGFFARTYCQREFENHGLSTMVAQCNMSFNHRRGTLRGMHYQAPPAAESKLIRCTRGALYYVLVDMRPTSPTFLEHVDVEISAKDRRAIYVPGLFAIGYQTLEDDTEAMYQVSEFYTPDAERGLRHDDPLLDLEWPLPVSEISAKDLAWPLLTRTQTGVHQ
jgi:dTDP-4-dehydrorhamnose 3,5-epimerase